jgi:hypothetical protein
MKAFVIGNGGETGLITYMRTDSVQVAPQAVQEARVVYPEEITARAYLPAKPPFYKNKAGPPRKESRTKPSRPTSALRDTSARLRIIITGGFQYNLYTSHLAAFCGVSDEFPLCRKSPQPKCWVKAAGTEIYSGRLTPKPFSRVFPRFFT